MKKHLLTYIFLLTSTLVVAQNNTEEALTSIETQEQAKQFIEDKYAFNSKIFTFNEEKHKTQLAKTLFKLEKGNVKSVTTEYDKTLYKILEKNSTPYYRVSYIYLDGSKYTSESINELRENLIKKYNNGTPFNALANQYSMDDNAKRGGDTGWFVAGHMYPDLENAVVSEQHALDDMYTIDIPLKKAYYLVLQTFEPKEISEIKVLKIVEPVE
ncbi:peptidylprolyl isomerase [Algibacter sp. 2305UL17-15]|uniref:peptidylprolyl isomerase n=1 Tax=Algibacter sp. 2305UL17-15 TaxID=3231268 RepID=UPI003459725B